MKKDKSTELWERIACDWINWGYKADPRIHYLMPFTLKQLGDVSGKTVLDLGCGEERSGAYCG